MMNDTVIDDIKVLHAPKLDFSSKGILNNHVLTNQGNKLVPGHSLQNTVNGHAAVVEVAKNFDFVIDLGHGNGIQNGLVNVGTGNGVTLGILVGVNQVEGGEIVVSAFLTGAGLAFSDAYHFCSCSHSFVSS